MTSNTNILNKLFTWKVIGLILSGSLISLALTAIGYYLFDKDSFWYEVFTQLGYAGFTGIIITLLSKYYFDKETPKQIADILTEQLGIDDLKSIMNLLPHHVSEKLKKDHSVIRVTDAIVDIFEERPREIFDRLFKNAEKNIDILTTNLDTLSQYDVDIERKMAQNSNLKIRLLALHPQHTFLRNRIESDRIYDDLNFFFTKIISSIRKFTQLKDKIKKNKDNLTIKIYDSPPSIMLYRFDDDLMLGFILKQASSRYYTHLVFRVSNEMAGCFLEHFEKVFETAKDITTGELDSMKSYES